MWKHPNKLNKIEDFSKPIIYWTWNNKCAVFKNLIVFYGGNPEYVGSLEKHIENWNWKVKKYNIKWWMFVEEIAPCGIHGCDEEDITKEMWDAIGRDEDELVEQMIKDIKKND
jgi:hypothetical protein